MMMSIQAQELIEANFGKQEVLKGLSVIERTDLMAEKYLELTKKSVENILLMSFIMYSAYGKYDYFERFLEKIKLTINTESSQFRKYCVIGQNFNKLSKFMNSLPCRWSTIYKIANLDESTLEKLVADGHLHSAVTAEQLLPYLPQKKKNVNCSVALNLINLVEVRLEKDLTQEQVNRVLGILEDLKEQRLITFETPQMLQLIATPNEYETEQLAA